MTSEFYIIATPIGNLGDITYRAVDTLKKCDVIACEDTRVTGVLAQKFAFGAKLLDCHKFNEKERSAKIISLLKSGKNTALVSDAGTPLISDPGSVLIEELRKENIKITSIPGACAVTVFLSQIPRETEEFAFIGFIPRSQKLQNEILLKYRYTNCVFYESPKRLMQTLENIMELYGPDCKTAVGRELTKLHEEVVILNVKDMIDYYNKNTLKGEIAVMVFAQKQSDINENLINEKINILKNEGFSSKDISKIISSLYGINKNKVYKMLT